MKTHTLHFDQHELTLPEAYDHDAYAKTTDQDICGRKLQEEGYRGDLESAINRITTGTDDVGWKRCNPLLRAETPVAMHIRDAMMDADKLGIYRLAEDILAMREAYRNYLDHDEGEQFAEDMQELSYRVASTVREIKRFF